MSNKCFAKSCWHLVVIKFIISENWKVLLRIFHPYKCSSWRVEDKSHSIVTCATTNLLQVNFCNKHLKNICVFLQSWLAVNELWHKWHWNDLPSTFHDEHLYGWKIHIFSNYLLQKLPCSKCVVAQVTLEWLVFHSPWWSLVCRKKTQIFFKYCGTMINQDTW